MKMYQKYSDKEIFIILKKRNSLTFNSKIELKKELDKRNLNITSNEYENLNELIEKKKNQIKEFKYLDKLGFQIEKFDENNFEIKRTTKAILIDLTALIMGIIMGFLGIFGLVGTIALATGNIKMNIMNLFIYVMLLIAGYVGISLTKNGFKRLIDFNNFNLTVKNNIVYLSKRFDLKLMKIEKEISKLKLIKEGNSIYYMLDKYMIFEVENANIENKLTMDELVNIVE